MTERTFIEILEDIDLTRKEILYYQVWWRKWRSCSKQSIFCLRVRLRGLRHELENDLKNDM